ncbi:MAG TPA: HAD family hydrolase, partial [Candidatus Paceibacterota bacterium]
MPDAIIFDLDGTIAKSKSPVTPEMGALIAKLAQRTFVAVMSGGSYKQYEKQFLPGMPAGEDYRRLFLFPTSAAQCYSWQDGTWTLEYDNELSAEERAKVLSALHDALAETGFDKPPPQLWGEQTEDRGSQITWSALGQEAPYEIKK